MAKFSSDDVYRIDILTYRGETTRALAERFACSTFKTREVQHRRGAYASVPRYDMRAQRAIVGQAYQRAMARRKGKAA